MYHGVLRGSQILLTLAQMPYGASYLETSITDGLQLAYLSQHHTHLFLCIVRKPFVAHLLKVVGYLYLHVIGYGLIALYAGILCLKLLLVLLVNQRAHHAKHAVHTLCIVHHLFLCLQHRYLRGLHHAATDEVHRGGLFLVSLVFRQKFTYYTFQLWYQSYEQGCI